MLSFVNSKYDLWLLKRGVGDAVFSSISDGCATFGVYLAVS